MSGSIQGGKFPTHGRLRLTAALFSLAAAALPPASAQTPVYESAMLGSTGVTVPVVSIGYDQFLGARFEVKTTVQVAEVGGHLNSLMPGPGGTLFAAILKLKSWEDLPDGGHPFGPLHPILATTTFNPPVQSADFLTPLSVSLPPGIYGLVFGAGEFGSPRAAHGGMPFNNTDLPGASYFNYDGKEGVEEWRSGGFSGVRFVIHGAGSAPAVCAAVTNAASFQTAGVAPGLIVSVFGQSIGPAVPVSLEVVEGKMTTRLAGVRVLFDGIPAPLIFVSSRQINAVTPYGVAGKPSTRVVVENNGSFSNDLTLPVLASLPAVFTLTQTGTGQAAVINQDGTLNGSANPAPRGSVISIYATGEGQTQPDGVDGLINTGTLPRPLLPVSVRIGGQEALVQYAGAAPQLVSGVLQLNAQVPTGIATGPEIPVVLISGGRSSSEGVTIAVR